MILVEAESFRDHGGWSLDQQFMDQMGSPYLLAHGLGEPVADARTTVEFPDTGAYRLWVRTKDWVAPWKAPGAPGRFQVLLDGKPVGAIFGTEGAEWGWQDGGVILISKTKTKIALHDMTGFDGRCDALLFCKDADFIPPGGGTGLAEFRRKAAGLPDKAQDAGGFDIVVAGGGVAGVCTAISAARNGLKVALLHDRPVLGGNNSSEVRVHLGGEINLPPYPRLGDIVREIGPSRQGNAQPADFYEDRKKLDAVRNERNISLFLDTHASSVRMDGPRIAALVGTDIRSGADTIFRAPLFVDCTGDGSVGFLAGAEFGMGREGKKETGESIAPDKGDKMTMGSSVQWYSLGGDSPSSFQDCPWALQFDEENCQPVKMGEWDWETGMDKDQIADAEIIRDYALRVVFGNWSFLKNKYSKSAEFSNDKLEWVAYVAGKRESRRLLGEIVLTQQDIQEMREFPDSCVTTTWTIDLHYPEEKNSAQFPGGEFRSIARHVGIKPYPIPYRCLFSRNVPNLFMAGRNISVTHVALGTVRVMRTTGMMGEVIGIAAGICRRKSCTPGDVYRKHLDEMKTLLASPPRR